MRAQVSQYSKEIQNEKESRLKLLHQNLSELGIINKTQSNFNTL